MPRSSLKMLELQPTWARSRSAHPAGSPAANVDKRPTAARAQRAIDCRPADNAEGDHWAVSAASRNEPVRVRTILEQSARPLSAVLHQGRATRSAAMAARPQ